MKENENNGTATLSDGALNVKLPKEYRELLEAQSHETLIDTLSNTVKHCIVVARNLWLKDPDLYRSLVAKSNIVEQNT